jgi:hypothetical protein
MTIEAFVWIVSLVLLLMSDFIGLIFWKQQMQIIQSTIELIWMGLSDVLWITGYDHVLRFHLNNAKNR